MQEGDRTDEGGRIDEEVFTIKAIVSTKAVVSTSACIYEAAVKNGRINEGSRTGELLFATPRIPPQIRVEL